ncbi:MAG: bifunctional lysine-specific demethylase and histidyl-hydroxylase [Solirubrobacteraceae bacterium]|nr:bifunctional lysine-specific demethylase and histidyl-hydroxylase [Solirubrobacteraceae bacterium]
MTAPPPAEASARSPSRPALLDQAVELALDPVTLPAFLDGHREREPLLVPRNEPGRFDPILSTADVERLVSTTAIRAPAFRLVKSGAQLPASGYSEDIPWRPGSFTGTARVDRVAEAFAAGATIVLQALHVNWHPAALYCRGLEQRLECPVQANAYYTPSSAQGFGVHHDTHDVLILQVGGRKRWSVYEPVLELPLKSQRWTDQLGGPGEPVMDVVLEAGDTLYLPRGWPHAAMTSDDESLHLTVGLHPPTRLDALRAALDACADDVEFRRSVPPDGGVDGDLLARLAARLDPGDVRRRTRRRFVASRRPILDDQIDQVRGLERLGAGDLLERRATVIADLDVTGDGAVLTFEGRDVVFPAKARAAVAAIVAAGEPFTAAELPDDLDGAGRLVLVRRLVREGFLRRV